MSNYRRCYEENYYIFITNIEILRKCFKIAKTKYIFEIFSMVVLPDHLHIIIKPETACECPKIIGSIKSSFTKSIDKKYFDKNISESRFKRREKGVWQRRFYEHTIKSEEELYKYLNYVHYNPVKHGYIQNVKDWKYSSFMKFVRMEQYDIHWGSSDNIKQDIENLIYDN